MMKKIRTPKMLTVLTILIIMSFFAWQAFAWTISRDFEGGTVGQVATGTSGFFWVNSGNIKFSNSVVHNGTKSVAAQFTSGSVDTTGATFEGNNATVSEGGEAWYRGYFYFPTGWKWNGTTKIMRFQTPRGYLSVLSGNGSIQASNEPAVYAGYDGQPGILEATGSNFDTGKWQCIEMYVKLSSTAGKGIFRIWKDGILIYQRTTLPTVSGPGQGLNDVNTLFNYWNESSPQNQTAYVDDIKITSDIPSNVDAQGNRMIGPTDWLSGNTALPAPTALRVTATAN